MLSKELEHCHNGELSVTDGKLDRIKINILIDRVAVGANLGNHAFFDHIVDRFERERARKHVPLEVLCRRTSTLARLGGCL